MIDLLVKAGVSATAIIAVAEVSGRYLWLGVSLLTLSLGVDFAYATISVWFWVTR